MAVAAPPRAPDGIQYKTVALDRKQALKALSTDPGQLVGYASVFDGVDAYGDTIQKGAYTETLPSFVERGTLHAEHDSRIRLGTIASAREDDHGLLVTADFHSTPEAQAVRTQILERIERGKFIGLSIGYTVDDFEIRSDGVRVLKKIRLYEVSEVSVPADQNAGVISAKSGGALMSVAQRMAARGLAPLPITTRRSIGERVASSAELKAFAAGRLQEASVNLDGISLKALVTSVPSPVDLRADLTEQPPIALSLIDVLPVYPTESNRVSIPRIGAVTNAAAPVAEASATTGASGLKPESALAFLDGTLPVQTIAHWLTATRTVLEDAGQAAALIDTELLLGLKLAAENQIINGTAVSPQLAGLLGLAGIGTVAVAASNYLAAVLSAMSTVRTASRRAPTVICLSSAAWVAVASAAAPGLLGISARGLPTLLGAEVVQSDVLPAGTGLVGVAATAPVFERQQASVTAGLVNDQFVRNLITMLAEVRLALVVSRQNAWCKITGMP